MKHHIMPLLERSAYTCITKDMILLAEQFPFEQHISEKVKSGCLNATPAATAEMWLCSPNPAAPNHGGPRCWGEISFTDGNYMCSMAFSVPIHWRVGTATLVGEDKSMVTMQEKREV